MRRLGGGGRTTGGPGHDVWSVNRGDGDGDGVRGARSGDDLDARASVISSGGKGSGSSSSGSSEWVAEGADRGGSRCTGDMRGSCLCAVLEGGIRVACRESCTFNGPCSYSLGLVN